MQNTEAVFFDRDGTIGGGNKEDSPCQIVVYDYTKEVFERLKRTGIKIFVFTNQACIARKKDNGYDFAGEFFSLGADDFFICPHDDNDNCNCRKPKNGLLIAAKEKYKLDLKNCFVVGDRWSDIECGQSVGAKSILVKTGRGTHSVKDNPKNVTPDFIADDIRVAADFILSKINN